MTGITSPEHDLNEVALDTFKRKKPVESKMKGQIFNYIGGLTALLLESLKLIW